MPIECSECEDPDAFCIYDDGAWICRNCFIMEGNTYEDWNEKCEQAAIERQQRRNERAYSEYNDFTPTTIQRNKNKICKFGCGTMLYWNDKLETKNKFVEVNTEKPHTFFRCSA